MTNNRTKPKKLRDSQRSAVYKWESSLPEYRESQRTVLSLSKCEALVEKAFSDFAPNLESPCVTDGRGRSSACYSRWLHAIKLPRWSRFQVVVLHETAHALCPPKTWHRPQFVSVYLDLLDAYLPNFDRARAEMLAVTQKPRRVRFECEFWSQ